MYSLKKTPTETYWLLFCSSLAGTGIQAHKATPYFILSYKLLLFTCWLLFCLTGRGIQAVQSNGIIMLSHKLIFGTIHLLCY